LKEKEIFERTNSSDSTITVESTEIEDFVQDSDVEEYPYGKKMQIKLGDSSGSDSMPKEASPSPSAELSVSLTKKGPILKELSSVHMKGIENLMVRYRSSLFCDCSWPTLKLTPFGNMWSLKN
jgi:hypothetical protein